MFKSYGTIRHHIFSSRWFTIKYELHTLKYHSTWSLERSNEIIVWQDAWCGTPLILETNMDFLISQDIIFYNKVKYFIFNGVWHFPYDCNSLFIFFQHIIHYKMLRNTNSEDSLIWPLTYSGGLSLKETYKFQASLITQSWEEVIWCNDIPPPNRLPFGN